MGTLPGTPRGLRALRRNGAAAPVGFESPRLRAVDKTAVPGCPWNSGAGKPGVTRAPPQGENSGVSLADVTGGGFLSLVGQLMDLVI